MNLRINVEEYNPEWPKIFENLKKIIWKEVKETAVAIEQVGSTSVPNLAAKPVIDMDIVVNTHDETTKVIQVLQRLGYQHIGNQGVPEREAFKRPIGSPKHNLYICLSSSLAFRNHILLRDTLRSDSSTRKEYEKLKLHLAEKFAGDIDGYCEAKTEFIISILKNKGLTQSEINEISNANNVIVPNH